MDCLYTEKCNKKDCEKDFCLKRYKLNYLFNQSLLPEAKWKPFLLYLDSDKTDQAEFLHLADIQENICQFVADGNNLYLFSTNCGNGKSSWAIKLLQAYLNKVWFKSALTCRALFISVPKFLMALKDNISNKNDYAEFIKANILSADLVVWDEIGNKIGSEFEVNYLLELLDDRLNLGKSNIYTANISYPQLVDKLGERLASRIYNSSDVIEFHGADKRGLNK